MTECCSTVLERRQGHQAPAKSRAWDLSFVEKLKRPAADCDYRAVQPLGNYQQEWEQGRSLGDEYVTFTVRHPTVADTTLLGMIVGSMMEKCATRGGRRGGELGFLRVVNEWAMVGAFAAGQVGTP